MAYVHISTKMLLSYKALVNTNPNKASSACVHSAVAYESALRGLLIAMALTHLPSSSCRARRPAMQAGLFTRLRSSPRMMRLARPVYVMATWALS